MKTDAEILKEGLLIEILLKINEFTPGGYNSKNENDVQIIQDHLSDYKYKSEEILDLLSRYERADIRLIPKELMKFDRIKRNTSLHKIKEALKNYPNGLTAKQIHLHTEMSLGNAHRILDILRKEGSVEHTDGLYILKVF